MNFTVTHRDGAARRGRMELAHGSVETPVFMPVGTYVVATETLGLDRIRSLIRDNVAGATWSHDKAKVEFGEKKINATSSGVSQVDVSGKVFVKATFNNVIVTITDVYGNTISWSSAGKNGFKGSRKSTPYAAALGEISGDVLVPPRLWEVRQRQAESFLVPPVQEHAGAVGEKDKDRGRRQGEAQPRG